MSRFERTCWRLAVAEATLLLLLANFFIRFIRFRFWRRSLGVMISRPESMSSNNRPLSQDCSVPLAIERACQLFSSKPNCLPRAMAAQWMFRRRAQASRLVFGIARSNTRDATSDLHAWVEINNRPVIGGYPSGIYIPLFAMALS